jgi:hypothetical protein
VNKWGFLQKLLVTAEGRTSLNLPPVEMQKNLSSKEKLLKDPSIVGFAFMNLRLLVFSS